MIVIIQEKSVGEKEKWGSRERNTPKPMELYLKKNAHKNWGGARQMLGVQHSIMVPYRCSRNRSTSLLSAASWVHQQKAGMEAE